jgi:hypothetical protein
MSSGIQILRLKKLNPNSKGAVLRDGFMPNIVSWFYIAECCRISRGLGGEGGRGLIPCGDYITILSYGSVPLKLFCLAEGHPTLFVGYNMFLVHACDKFV